MAKIKGEQTALTKWDEELAGMADVAAKDVASSIGGQFLSIKSGGIMYLGGQNVLNNQLAVVVAAHTHEHAYYTQAFDPEKPATPVCFAFGDDEATMVPHESSTKKQSDKCSTCPRNKFPSKEETKKTGRKGKECKNLMRLALLPCGSLDVQGHLDPNLEPEDYETATPVYLRVSVTSVKNFATYVLQLRDILKPKRPPCAVFTRIKGVPHQKNQSETLFDRLDPLPGNDLVPVLLNRHKELQATIGFPYQGSAEDEAPATNGKVKARKFAK